MSSKRIPKEVRQRVREQAENRCGYCQSQQQYVLGPLEIEHIISEARDGTNDENNLWLACRLCNSYKGVQVDAVDPITSKRTSLFNPRTQMWAEHFRWDESKTRIMGLTSTGRATVIALQLNNLLAVTVRRAWVEAGWHPPSN